MPQITNVGLPQLPWSISTQPWLADPIAVGNAKLKINKKGGTTLSPIKLGGWEKTFKLAKEIGSWPKVDEPKKVKTRKSSKQTGP